MERFNILFFKAWFCGIGIPLASIILNYTINSLGFGVFTRFGTFY
jgi:hypothetical protein